MTASQKSASHKSSVTKSTVPKKSATAKSDTVKSGVVPRLVRLQKVLAEAGFGSRRSCELLITAGRVEVDRNVVTSLGTKVDLSYQEVRVDTQSLKKRARSVAIAFNKPRGTLCTMSDPQGRTRVTDLIPEKWGRLFPVGRLDRESEGLLLMTNDGDLAQRLTHPSFGVTKVYRVLVAGEVLAADVAEMRRGVRLAEQWVRAENVIIKGRRKQSTILELTLSEGINREIRRMLARLGHKVMRLQRIAIGTLRLGNMLPGEWRELTRDELAKLRKSTSNTGSKTPRNKTPHSKATSNKAPNERRS